jgi:xylose isomerase
MFALYISQGIHYQGMELKDTPARLEMFFLQLWVLLSNVSCSVKKWNWTNIGFFCGNRRRESTNVEDMFLTHILEMDTLAHGLHNVVKLIEVIKKKLRPTKLFPCKVF